MKKKDGNVSAIRSNCARIFIPALLLVGWGGSFTIALFFCCYTDLIVACTLHNFRRKAYRIEGKRFRLCPNFQCCGGKCTGDALPTFITITYKPLGIRLDCEPILRQQNENYHKRPKSNRSILFLITIHFTNLFID